MNRSEQELEELIDALSAHYGEDSFAIINDIVRAAFNDPEPDILASVHGIFGGSPYVPAAKEDEPSHQKPQEPKFVGSPQRKGKVAHLNANAKTGSSTQKKTRAKKTAADSPARNSFEALDADVELKRPIKPIKSIWETVNDENRAATFEDKGEKKDDDDEYIEEEVEMDALEDVDPIALAMEENPDFFKPVPTTAELELSLGIHISQVPQDEYGDDVEGVDGDQIPDDFEGEENSGQGGNDGEENQNDNDGEKDDSSPSYYSRSVRPDWMTQSGAKFFVRNHTSSQVRSLSSSVEITHPSSVKIARGLTPESTQEQDSKTENSEISTTREADSSTIDYWLPQTPQELEQARQSYERIIEEARASSEGAGGAKYGKLGSWSSNGDFAIAPAAHNIKMSSSGADWKVTEPVEVEFKLDEEALSFLGELFPDFDASYLAECLRGADNSVERVSEFLLPVECEEIEINDGDSWLSIIGALPQRDDVKDNGEQKPTGEDSKNVEDDSKGEEEGESISELPQEDSKFNENYLRLVEIYPMIDRDWILDALLEKNDLERAVDVLMRALTEDGPAMREDEDSDPLPGAHMRPGKARPKTGQMALKPSAGGWNKNGRQNRKGANNRRNMILVPAAPASAWDRPMGQMPASDAPLSEYPLLTSDSSAPEYYDGRESPVVLRPKIEATNPNADPERRLYRYSELASKLPKANAFDISGTTVIGERNVKTGVNSGRILLNSVLNSHDYGISSPSSSSANSVSYIPADIRDRDASGSRVAGNWALLVARANAMFEESTDNKRAAAAAFAKHRGAIGSIMAALRDNNSNWERLMQQAGKEFYEDDMKRVDLHCLRLKPASKFVAAILQAHWENGTEYRVLEIITGRGSHSADGVARIKEDVKRQVRNYRHEWLNDGCVRVLLPKPEYRS